MRTLLTLAIGILVGSGVTLAQRQGGPLLADDVTRAAVTRIKHSIVQGHRMRDRAALNELYAEDYTALDARGGIRSKEDLLRALPSDPEMVEGSYQLTTVRRWGSVAVASGHGRMVYRNGDGGTRVSEYDTANVFAERGGTPVCAEVTAAAHARIVRSSTLSPGRRHHGSSPSPMISRPSTSAISCGRRSRQVGPGREVS